MLAGYLKRGMHNTITYAAASAVTRMLSFLFLPYFLEKLSLKDFGVWDFWQTFFSLGSLLLSSCAALSMTRFYLLYKDDLVKQKQAVGNMLLLCVSGVIVFITCVCSALWFTHVNYDNDYLYLMTATVSLFACFSMVLAYLRVTEQLIPYLIIFCVQNILTTLLTVVGVYYGFGLRAFFYSQFITLLLMLPGFIYVTMHNRLFSWPLLKEQMLFSIPLFLYNLLYAGFFTVDRFFIQQTAGYEVLGLYALLWRFGSLFQFGAIALTDAWPIVMYNAQKEENGNTLISQLTVYFCIALTSLNLGVLVASRCVIDWFFPTKYHMLLSYLPAFFLFVLLLELVKIFQSGFGLSAKTTYAPILTSLALSIQAGLFFIVQTQGLISVLSINTLALLCYCCMSYYMSCKVYSSSIFNMRILLLLMILFLIYILGIYYMLVNTLPWYSMILLLLSWPLLLWLLIVDDEGKDWVRSCMAFIRISEE